MTGSPPALSEAEGPRLSSSLPVISIAAPFYNEGAGVDLFFQRLIPILQDLGESWEIVCVNDGSRDDTLQRLLRHAAAEARIVVLDLSRNFGKEQALTAALDHARGRAVIPIDSDLQDPPELIPEMLRQWRAGADVVYATRSARPEDGWMKRSSAQAFYRLYNRLAQVGMPPDTGDFRLMDRKVVDALSLLRERNRFMKGMFAWLGYRQASVSFVRADRTTGQSSFNFWKLWNFALDGITASTTLPLRASLYAGLGMSAVAFVYVLYLLLRLLVMDVDVPGYTSIMVVVLGLGGIQLVILGVIGEYLGRMYQEIKQRPIYLVRESWNLRRPEPPSG